MWDTLTHSFRLGCLAGSESLRARAVYLRPLVLLDESGCLRTCKVSFRPLVIISRSLGGTAQNLQELPDIGPGSHREDTT
jgi:hypothetical protein